MPSEGSSNSESLTKKLDRLITVLEKSHPSSTRRLVWQSFLRGLFTGIGTTIGLSILVAGVTYLLAQAQVIPLLREFVATFKPLLSPER